MGRSGFEGRRCWSRVNPHPQSWLAQGRGPGRVVGVNTGILSKEEGQKTDVRLVGKGTCPEHVEYTRLLGFAWGLLS